MYLRFLSAVGDVCGTVVGTEFGKTLLLVTALEFALRLALGAIIRLDKAVVAPPVSTIEKSINHKEFRVSQQINNIADLIIQ